MTTNNDSFSEFPATEKIKLDPEKIKKELADQMQADIKNIKKTNLGLFQKLQASILSQNIQSGSPVIVFFDHKPVGIHQKIHTKQAAGQFVRLTLEEIKQTFFPSDSYDRFNIVGIEIEPITVPLFVPRVFLRQSLSDSNGEIKSFPISSIRLITPSLLAEMILVYSDYSGFFT